MIFISKGAKFLKKIKIMTENNDLLWYSYNF